MQITLEQAEIEEGVKMYIHHTGLVLGNADPEITLTAGRGPAGITAAIDLPKVTPLHLGVIPGKEKNDSPEVFATDEDLNEEDPKPAPKAAPKKTAAKKPGKKKKAVKEEPPVIEDELLVEEEIPVEESADLFGGLEEETPVEEGEALTDDSLFA